MLPIRLILVVLAAVLFGVSAYLSPTLGEKLTNVGLFALAVAYLWA